RPARHPARLAIPEILDLENVTHDARKVLELAPVRPELPWVARYRHRVLHAHRLAGVQHRTGPALLHGTGPLSRVPTRGCVNETPTARSTRKQRPAAEQEGSSHRPAASDARSHESAAKKGGPHSLPAADVRTGAQSGQRPRPGDTLASLTILELLGIVVIGSPLDLPQLPHRPQPAGFRLLLVLR